MADETEVELLASLLREAIEKATEAAAKAKPKSGRTAFFDRTETLGPVIMSIITGLGLGGLALLYSRDRDLQARNDALAAAVNAKHTTINSAINGLSNDKTRFASLLVMGAVDREFGLRVSEQLSPDGTAAAAGLSMILMYRNADGSLDGRAKDFLYRCVDGLRHEEEEIDRRAAAVMNEFEGLVTMKDEKSRGKTRKLRKDEIDKLVDFNKYIESHPEAGDSIGKLMFGLINLAKLGFELPKDATANFEFMISMMEPPAALVEKARHFLDTLDQFPDIYKRYYARFLADGKRRVADIENLVRISPNTMEAKLQLLDLYLETRDLLAEADADWKELSAAINAFITLSRTKLIDSQDPTAFFFEADYDRLSKAILKCKADRIESLQLNARAIRDYATALDRAQNVNNKAEDAKTQGKAKSQPAK